MARGRSCRDELEAARHRRAALTSVPLLRRAGDGGRWRLAVEILPIARHRPTEQEEFVTSGLVKEIRTNGLLALWGDFNDDGAIDIKCLDVEEENPGSWRIAETVIWRERQSSERSWR